jgi:hypothetical protein
MRGPAADRGSTGMATGFGFGSWRVILERICRGEFICGRVPDPSCDPSVA